MPFSGSGATAKQPAEELGGGNPGALIANPTSLTAPYGGTHLGRLHQDGVSFVPDFVISGLTFRKQSPYPYDYWFSGIREVFVICRFEEWDDDVLQVAFPGGMTTAGASERKVTLPGTLAPGPMSAETATIYFAPDLATQKAFIVRKAAYAWEETQALSMERSVSTRIPVVFRSTPDTAITAAEQIATVGLRSDLSLTP